MPRIAELPNCIGVSVCIASQVRLKSALETYRLFVNIHQMIPNTKKRQYPTKTLVANPASFLRSWVCYLQLLEEFVALVGVAVG
jgi:hypothetical protein